MQHTSQLHMHSGLSKEIYSEPLWSKHRKKNNMICIYYSLLDNALYFENLIHYVPQKSNRHDSAINSMPLKNRTTSYRNGLSRLGIFLRTSKEKANMAR